MANIFYIIIALALVLLNAFFVAAEFGMVRLRTTKVVLIAEEYPWRGTILAKVHRQLDAYLSACQLGITLSSLGLGWIGEPAFAELLTPILEQLGFHSATLIELISFLFAFSLLSFLHIVVGELMPKSLAIRQSEKISLWTAAPLYAFYWLMFPVIWSLNYCSNLFLKLLGLDIVHPGEQFHSSEEIKLILESSEKHGELSAQETTILAHTLELSDLKAVEVMRPADVMIKLPQSIPKQKLLAIMNRYRYSRYPVYDDKQRAIIGLLHVKDVQTVLQNKLDEQIIDLSPIVREIPRISHRLPALVLLKRFQGGMPHFALICSRQGSVIGFVTLDNLLHLVLGVIKDEFHKTQDAWTTHADGSITVRGDCPIYTLERALNRELDLTEEQEEEVATVGGLLLYELGSVPQPGDEVELHDFFAQVEKMQGTRIISLRIKPKKPNSEAKG